MQHSGTISIYCSIVVARPHTCTLTPCKGHLLHVPHEGVAGLGIKCHLPSCLLCGRTVIIYCSVVLASLNLVSCGNPFLHELIYYCTISPKLQCLAHETTLNHCTCLGCANSNAVGLSDNGSEESDTSRSIAEDSYVCRVRQ